MVVTVWGERVINPGIKLPHWKGKAINPGIKLPHWGESSILEVDSFDSLLVGALIIYSSGHGLSFVIYQHVL
jgi:hypothetical protein